jgi:AbrB family looped-hinge helix DNA binding protein
MQKVVRQLRHGQITIPKDLREAIGLSDEDMLSITLAGNKLEIEPVRVTPRATGSPWARELYEMFAPTRESLRGVPEEDLNKAIDEALEEARKEKA